MLCILSVVIFSLSDVFEPQPQPNYLVIAITQWVFKVVLLDDFFLILNAEMWKPWKLQKSENAVAMWTFQIFVFLNFGKKYDHRPPTLKSNTIFTLLTAKTSLVLSKKSPNVLTNCHKYMMQRKLSRVKFQNI